LCESEQIGDALRIHEVVHVHSSAHAMSLRMLTRQVEDPRLPMRPSTASIVINRPRGFPSPGRTRKGTTSIVDIQVQYDYICRHPPSYSLQT
jgi:hypothetical protein